MLSLDIQKSKSFAQDFEKQHIQSLKDARNRVIGNGTVEVVINKKTKKIYLSKANRKLLQKHLNDKTIKFLMICTPREQRKVIKSLKKKFPSIHNQKTNIYQFLKYIFITNGYDKLDTEAKKLFYRDLKINSCIYCNRNYIFDVKENGHIKGNIDHFYPKAKYPYFAVSYYNLIPSCQTCNGFGAKGKIDTFNDKKIIHPYEVNVNDFKFTYKPTDISFSQIESQKYDIESFEIELYGNKANLEVFKLVELYKQHKDIVVDLLMKKAYYPKSYIEELEKNFGFSEDEIYRYLLGNYKKDEDLHKRPLSKLIKDISKELKLT
jgi:hypothetical protein